MADKVCCKWFSVVKIAEVLMAPRGPNGAAIYAGESDGD
jgi:hypothetical protein